MAKYKLTSEGVLLKATGQHIPENPNEDKWQDYLKWLSHGNVPDPINSAEELMDMARESKKSELLNSYATEASVPVVVNSIPYPCGEMAAISIDQIIRAAKLLGQVDCDIPDVDDIDRLVALVDADNILRAIVQQLKPLVKKRRRLLRDVRKANSVAEINSITW